MSKIKLEHYVPQFYLRNFAKKIKKNYFIEVFDKKEEKQSNANISKIACEKFFYDEGENQDTEKSLSKFESLFNASLNKLLSLKDVDKLSNEDRIIFSLFIAIQYLRTKDVREVIKIATDGLNKKLSKEKLSKEVKEQLEALKKEEEIKLIHVDLIKDFIPFAEIIFQMKWVLLLNKSSLPFWTSDNPLAFV